MTHPGFFASAFLFGGYLPLLVTASGFIRPKSVERMPHLCEMMKWFNDQKGLGFIKQ